MRIPALAALCLAAALPAGANEHWPQFGDVITPTAAGLLRTTEEGIPRDPMPFGTGFQDVMHVLVGVHGHEVSVGFPPECGAGPMVSASIPGAIDLMFQDDVLVGWMLIGDAQLTTDTGLRVGAPRSILSASGPVEFFESGIGTEFSAGEFFGLMTESADSVQGVWAGTTCIFR